MVNPTIDGKRASRRAPDFGAGEQRLSTGTGPVQLARSRIPDRDPAGALGSGDQREAGSGCAIHRGADGDRHGGRHHERLARTGRQSVVAD